MTREINQSGRTVYFYALGELWPEPLNNLMDSVAPQFASLWKDRPIINNNSLSGHSEWYALLTSRLRHPTQQAKLALWSRAFSMSDEWIIDAAVNTILYHYEAHDGTLMKTGDWIWVYIPPYLRIPFEPSLNNAAWSPSPSNISQLGLGETWGGFSGRMRRQFEAELKAYRQKVITRRGLRKQSISRDAEWTVRYQRGEKAKDIAADLTGPYRDHGQAVFRAISRFAQDIGLTLTRRR